MLVSLGAIAATQSQATLTTTEAVMHTYYIMPQRIPMT
jgi:hypothetical protein